jgi:hypothetical protein
LGAILEKELEKPATIVSGNILQSYDGRLIEFDSSSYTPQFLAQDDQFTQGPGAAEDTSRR